MDADNLADIRARLTACPIPELAVADWDGSNHYEIQDHGAESNSFWWLDYIDEAAKGGSQSEEGKRLGAVLDYSCHYRRDVGTLLAEIDRLQKVPRGEKCASRRPTRS